MQTQQLLPPPHHHADLLFLQNNATLNYATFVTRNIDTQGGGGGGGAPRETE